MPHTNFQTMELSKNDLLIKNIGCKMNINNYKVSIIF